MFWSSADLTGNQTVEYYEYKVMQFWSSADLTGNQTDCRHLGQYGAFWSSADLTGNQTLNLDACASDRERLRTEYGRSAL